MSLIKALYLYYSLAIDIKYVQSNKTASEKNNFAGYLTRFDIVQNFSSNKIIGLIYLYF